MCNDEVNDRRRHYCSKKSQRIAYAVLERYQWDQIREEVLDRGDRRCVRLEPDRFTPDYTLRLEEPQPPEELPEYVVD